MSDVKKPTLCVIAGGGCAQIEVAAGALKVIDRKGIKIDEYRGSSAGAFSCALHASGVTGAAMEKLIRETPVRKLFKLSIAKTALRFAGIAMRGFYDAEGMYDIMRRLTTPQGRKKVKVTVTREEDEKSFMTNATLPAIMASGAIPVIFASVKIGLKFFVDGGVTNMIPVPSILHICNEKHADYDKIIIIICPDAPVAAKQPCSLIAKAVKAFLATMKRQVTHFEKADWNKLKNVVVIKPEDYDVDLMSWSNHYELIAIGEAAAEKAFNEKEIAS